MDLKQFIFAKVLFQNAIYKSNAVYGLKLIQVMVFLSLRDYNFMIPAIRPCHLLCPLLGLTIFCNTKDQVYSYPFRESTLGKGFQVLTIVHTLGVIYQIRTIVACVWMQYFLRGLANIWCLLNLQKETRVFVVLA